MAVKEKNIWILIIFILSGLVVGGLLGQFAANVDWLSWMSYGQQFGIGQTRKSSSSRFKCITNIICNSF